MKCFIDLDGVLANFPQAASDAHNKPNPYHSLQWHGEYALDKIFKMSAEAFWEKLRGREFWEGITPMLDAPLIIEACEKQFGSENCCILTSPNLDPESATGKMVWVQHHFPAYQRRLLIGACKEFCAHTGALLIDDTTPNCKKFINHGGYAFLLPRPWNPGYGQNAVHALNYYLEQLQL